MRRAALALTAAALTATALTAGAGCRPELDATASLIASPRLLAVRAEPAEARPGETVELRAILATPAGQVDGAALDWAFCGAPKPLADNNVVAAACLADDAAAAGALDPIEGRDPVVTAMLPADGCSLFGPELPPQSPDLPPQRPRDADPTGGYYQPVVLRWGEVTGVALPRLSCHLAGASVDVSLDFNRRYTPNRNPTLLPLALPATVTAGRTLGLQARWTDDSAESFVVFDRAAGALVTTRETLRVSWFTTGGRFATDVTGPAARDGSALSTNQWTTPDVAGRVHLWAVLRDSRGGVDVATAEVTITAP